MYNDLELAKFKSTCPANIFVHTARSKGLGIFTVKGARANEVLFHFTGNMVPFEEAHPLSLQLSEDLFLRGEGQFDDLINHSCDPNGVVYFDGLRASLKASRDIQPGEELTFNYNTTEFDLLRQSRVFRSPCDFECSCESSFCQGRVTGFRHLPLEDKVRISRHISPFLRFKLMEDLWQWSLLQPEAVEKYKQQLPWRQQSYVFLAPPPAVAR